MTGAPVPTLNLSSASALRLITHNRNNVIALPKFTDWWFGHVLPSVIKILSLWGLKHISTCFNNKLKYDSSKVQVKQWVSETYLQSIGGVSFRSVDSPKCCTHVTLALMVMSATQLTFHCLYIRAAPETMRLCAKDRVIYRCLESAGRKSRKTTSSEGPTALPPSVGTSTANMPDLRGIFQVVTAGLVKRTAVVLRGSSFIALSYIGKT